MDSLQGESQNLREIPKGLSTSDVPGTGSLAELIKRRMNLDSEIVSSTPVVPASTSFITFHPDMYDSLDEQRPERSCPIEPEVSGKEDVANSENQFSALADQCNYVRKIIKTSTFILRQCR